MKLFVIYFIDRSISSHEYIRMLFNKIGKALVFFKMSLKIVPNFNWEVFMTRWLAVFILLFCGTLAAQTNKIIFFQNGDIIHGATKDSEDGKSLKIQSENFGQITTMMKNVKRIASPVVETADVSMGSGDRVQTGLKLPNEDRLFGNLLRFVEGNLRSVNLSGVKTIAIKRVIVNGKYDVNDRVFEARLITILARMGYTVVERQALSILMKEQQLSLTGLTSGDPKVGKLLGVDAFLSIELEASRKGHLEAAMKLVNVERNDLMWEETLTGDYYSPLRLWVSAKYSQPLALGVDYYPSVGIKTGTGHLVGASGGFGMQMSGRFSFLEIGILGYMLGDVGLGKRTDGSALESTGTTTSYSLQSVSVTGGYPLFIKIHPSELFNSPRDILRIYAGLGSEKESVTFNTKSSLNNGINKLNMGGSATSLLAGIELAPVRDIAFFADMRYLLNSKATGAFVTQVLYPDRVKFGMGFSYYIKK